MQDINGYERFIGLLPGCYSMGVSHPETFVAGANLVLNSAEAPLTALTVYGHSTQDGTPSPDNPVPIVSAGDSGEINVTVSGKNLLDTTKGSLTVGKPYVLNGRTYLLNADGTVDITTQDATRPTSSVFLNNGPIYLPYGEYTVSGNDTSIAVNVQIVDSEDTNVRQINVNTGQSKTFEIDSGEHIKYIWMYGDAGTEINGKVSAQIEIGTVATAYEPYKTPQTLTLSTPGGLPGIPVTSGGNYTDADGQQWVCDEIDLARGKYVQRLNKKILTSALPWRFVLTTGNGNNNFQILLTSEEGATGSLSGKPVNSMCNFLKYAGLVWDDNEINLPKIYASNLEITASFPPDSEVNSLQKWNELLDGIGNCYIYYILDIPIETPLSAEEIAAYKALHTYSPTTTVSNDAEAWMKVGYYGLTTIQKLEKEAIVINGGKS